jgi:Amt family ammonium transporter
VAGLATITPAAGYVNMPTAFLIGIIASVSCFYAVKIKNHFRWDDALDVWGIHGVGGFLGTILLGVFATLKINPNGANGLIYGNYHFFIIQVITTIISAAYAFGFTYLMLVVLNKFIRVKVTPQEEEIGLDAVYHGELARA